MNILEEIEKSILASISDAVVTVSGGGGHFNITVISASFEGKNTIQRQRLVYKAIWNLMAGDAAPLHAVDSLVCKTSAE